MRSLSCLLPAALCLVACSVDVEGSGSGEPGDFWDGGSGLDASMPIGDGAAGGDATLESCTGVAQQTRLRFEQAQVVAPATCNSETQRRTCSGGVYSAWSGSFTSETCELAPYSSCGSTVHGGQEKRTRYEAAVTLTGCKKEEQTRTCDDGDFGDWTGSYTVESCSIGFLGNCDLLFGEFPCQPGTTCMPKGGLSLDAVCLGNLSHACSANNDCITGTTCVSGVCSVKSLAGGACEEQSDCAGCLGGSSASVSCAQNVCRCSDTSNCTNNNQCLGTCVSNKCVQANTTCDAHDDCRDEYECKTPPGRSKGCYLPDGKACTVNSQCANVCRSNQCAPLGKVSEVCDEDADCGELPMMQKMSCVPITAGSIVYNGCSILESN